MKTAIRKKVWRKIKTALSFLLLFFATLVLFCSSIMDGRSVPMGVKVHAESKTSSYEQSYVMDDLKGMTIQGNAFNIAHYGFTSTKKANVLTFAEYCYSYDTEKQGNFGLYVYVHNPNGLYFSDSVLNQISLRINGIGNFKKYTLDMLSVCEETDYERLFYKFAIRLTDGERTDILTKLSSSSRVYEIGEIELLQSGKANAAAYAVGSIYRYSGYAAGYGAVDTAGSTLKYTREDMETLSLDVHPTFYRPAGTNGKNDYTQDSLHSVYFAVPNTIIQKYGKMTAVHATWLSAVLAPILVTGNYEAYQAILPYLGVSAENLDDLTCLYLGAFQYTGNGDYVNFGYNYNDYELISAVLYNRAYYGSAVDPLCSIYYSGSSEKSADNYTVPSADLLADLKNSKDKYGGALINNKYSWKMFESCESNFTEFNIKAEDKFPLTSQKISQTWWQKLSGGGTIEDYSDRFNNVNGIYEVKEADLIGEDQVVADRLLIDRCDVSAFKSYYSENKNNSTVYLLRYRITDYISQEATLFLEEDYVFGGTFWEEKDTNAYFFQQTVDLDFDIIDVTFSSEGVDTVIAVVSDPMDVVHDATPPVYTKPDKEAPSCLNFESCSGCSSGLPSWVWVLIVIVVLWIIGKFFPPIWNGIKIVFLVVTVPIWGIPWLIIKLIKKIRGDDE